MRPKLLDSVYLLLTALSIVGVLITLIVFQNTYDKAPWMPHGDKAKQLLFALMGFGFGAVYLYSARQSRRLQSTLSGKAYLRSLGTLITPPWVSIAMSVIGFAAGIYFLCLFVGISHVNMTSASALFQLFVGVALVVSGIMLLKTTVKVKREVPLTTSHLIFGTFFPALLIASGFWRLMASCWQLLRLVA